MRSEMERSRPGAARAGRAGHRSKTTSWNEFQAALKAWKMPTIEFVYADVDEPLASWRLVPTRGVGPGLLPVPGDDDRYEWRDDAARRLPRLVSRQQPVASANASVARLGRIERRWPILAARRLESSSAFAMSCLGCR